MVDDRRLVEGDRLLRRMIDLGLVGAAHDHLRARCSPDRRLIALTEEPRLGSRSPDDQAGLMSPVVPGSTDGKQALVPDHLADDLEADPSETGGDLGGVDPACQT